LNTLDIIIGLILILGIIKGFSRGSIVELFTFFALVLGIFLAINLTVPVINWLKWENGYQSIQAIIVFAGLFILINIGIKILAKIIKKALDLTFLGSIDSLFGAVIGLCKWAFIISSFFWVIESLGIDFEGSYAKNSFIFPFVQPIAPVFTMWIAEFIPYFRELFDNLTNIGKENGGLIT